jgi:hypothetical protein
MKTVWLAAIGVAGSLIAPIAGAAQYVYPAKGQDQATQAKDEAECSTWATQQTGFAPGQASATIGAPTGGVADTSAVTSALGGLPGGAGGALPGGAAGALGSAAGGSGVTSALGAIPGGATGGAGQLATASQLVGMVNQATGKAPPQASGQPEFDKARAVCLNGRGYSVQ